VNALYELADILKANGYVAASEGFEEQPAVMIMKGASALLAESLGDCGVHARTAIEVNSLPGGAPVGLMSSLSA
jgi:enamine deaminase RidA (YjgF/YER057c/UK114 family)